jgi:hypothetical protein
MYSGTTLTPISGRLFGAHQKIDRVARKSFESLTPKAEFPAIKEILHFEGVNGPDAIKRKSRHRTSRGITLSRLIRTINS